jgi:hypothetical protein
MIDHPFEPYTYGDKVICSHIDLTRGYGQVCSRPESEHDQTEDIEQTE